MRGKPRTDLLMRYTLAFCSYDKLLLVVELTTEPWLRVVKLLMEGWRGWCKFSINNNCVLENLDFPDLGEL